MLFNTFEFLLFFPVVTLLYHLTPRPWRWLLLLLASCVFYMAFIPVYIFILVFTITVDYLAGLGIEKSAGRRRKLFLLFSIAANLGMLCVFKYYDFFTLQVNHLLHLSGSREHLPYLALLLPVGLSFHTFQSLSYTLEVYHGRQKAERHYGFLALYVLFYPQLVAGPIERPQHLLPQLHAPQPFSPGLFSSGLRLMAWGLFKKSVIADRAAECSDALFSHPQRYSGWPLWVGVLLFSIQIYCDFSGYADMAIGSARTMGIQLSLNFRRPYFAHSIAELWQRWHMSLYRWFRDYVYIPLGGNRVSKVRQKLNVLFVFLLSGLWHGANWTYICYGFCHGIMYNLSTWHRISWKAAWTRPFRILFTFLLLSLAYIFFRARSLSDAGYIFLHLLDTSSAVAYGTVLYGFRAGIHFYSHTDWFILLGSILLLFITEGLQEYGFRPEWRLLKLPLWLRWPAYYAFFFALAFLGVYEHRAFVYFSF